MKRSPWLVLAAGLALIGATAAFLLHHKTVQQLGHPGLKVVAVPTQGHDPSIPGNTNLTVISPHSVPLPEKVPGYDSRLTPVSRVVYEWLPPDTVYGQRVYWAPDGFYIMNSVVLMGADRTSIHKPQYCLPAQGHQILREEPDTIPMDRPYPYDLPVMKVFTSGQIRSREGQFIATHGVFLYWFVADGQMTAQHAQMQWWMARDLLRHGVLQRWGYVAIFALCPPGQEEETTGRLKKFIAATVPDYQLVAGIQRGGTPAAASP